MLMITVMLLPVCRRLGTTSYIGSHKIEIYNAMNEILRRLSTAL